MQEITLPTLGDVDDALSIAAYCASCERSRQLDLRGVTERYGSALRPSGI
jgi:hypothetical protein